MLNMCVVPGLLQLGCNRVDNTHPDTLARPFTFAPLHLAPKPNVTVRSLTSYWLGAEGHARPEQQTLVEKVSLVLWSYKHVYPGKILIRNDAVASHYLSTLLHFPPTYLLPSPRYIGRGN